MPSVSEPLDPETTPWEVLFKARGGLTSKQVEVLSILASRGHILVADIAFELCTTPQAAGRVVNALTRKRLAYEDYIGGGSKNHITLSVEGRAFIDAHDVPV